MTDLRHPAAILATAVVLFFAAPGTAGAQGLTLGAHGGLAVPTGDFATFEDPGMSLGLQGGYHLSPRFELRADLGYSNYQEEINQATGAEIPDFSLLSFRGGADYELTAPEESRWDISANAAVGLTNVSTDTVRTGTDLSTFSSTYPSAALGVTLGYDVSEETRPHVEFYVSGEGEFVFADEAETSRFDPFSPDLSGGMSTITTWPVEAGISLQF